MGAMEPYNYLDLPHNYLPTFSSTILDYIFPVENHKDMTGGVKVGA